MNLERRAPARPVPPRFAPCPPCRVETAVKTDCAFALYPSHSALRILVAPKLAKADTHSAVLRFGAWNLVLPWNLELGRLELRLRYSLRSRRQMGHRNSSCLSK